MKKIILSIAMIASISFIGCSDDEGGNSDCKSCDDIAGIEGLNLEVCDNGDGTATITSSFLGSETSEEFDLDGESIDDLDCSDFASIDFSALTNK